MFERISFQFQSYFENIPHNICCTPPYLMPFKEIFQKRFWCLLGKKKQTAQHLENMQGKLPLHMSYVKIVAWMGDFTFMFPGGLINARDKKRNYENALLPSSIV